MDTLIWKQYCSQTRFITSIEPPHIFKLWQLFLRLDWDAGDLNWFLLERLFILTLLIMHTSVKALV